MCTFRCLLTAFNRRSGKVNLGFASYRNRSSTSFKFPSVTVWHNVDMSPKPIRSVMALLSRACCMSASSRLCVALNNLRPWACCASGYTPHSHRHSSKSLFPVLTAHDTAVQPSASGVVASAPSFGRNFTKVSSCPSLARYSGVRPRPSIVSKFAPCSSKSFARRAQGSGRKSRHNTITARAGSSGSRSSYSDATA